MENKYFKALNEYIWKFLIEFIEQDIKYMKFDIDCYMVQFNKVFRPQNERDISLYYENRYWCRIFEKELFKHTKRFEGILSFDSEVDFRPAQSLPEDLINF